MNKLKTLGLALAMVFSTSLLMTSCGSDDEGDDLDGDDCGAYLQELATDLSNKGQIFTQNPNEANCLAVKNAGILLSEVAIECGHQQFETLAAQYKDLDCSPFD